MTTVSTIINAACRQLGFTPTAAEAADAMTALNHMLAEWALAPAGVYVPTRENFNLVASTSSYTIGSGQTFNTALPVRIFKAFTRTDNIDYPIETYFGMEGYADLALKTTTGRPYALYFERSHTTGTVFFYPTPDAAYAVHLWSKKALGFYTSLSDTLNLPTEYEPVIKFNLPVEIAAEFGIDIKPQTAIRAEQSLTALKRFNAQPIPQINTDPLGHSGGFDIDMGWSR